MSTSPLTIAAPRQTALAKALDYLELTKPKIAVLELVVVLAAGFVATWGQPHDPALLLHALVGTLLIAASASAANQWLERRLDARMPRTADRPLPACRLSPAEAIAFSGLTLIAGAIYLGWLVNAACLAWALLTWALYVLAYTPLKTVSTANTAVGAVAGSLPVMIGWSAAGGALGARAAALVLVLFLWQFPHFMAIAWLYRKDYAGAGYRMLTVVDPSGRRAGWQSVVAALALVPVSLIPMLGTAGVGGALYAAGASLLGIGYLALAARFWRQADDRSARLLLRGSLVYLPTLLVMLLLAPWI